MNGSTYRIPRGMLLPILLACFVGFVAGCRPDNNKEIALYRAVLDGQNPARVDYREGQPLTLPDALALANQHSERLAIAGEDFVQALADKERAASSFFPTISLSPSYSKADASGDSGNQRVTGGGANDENQLRGNNAATGDGKFDTPVNLNANVFRGFRDVANLRRAGSDINRFRALLLDLQATVLLDVSRAYYSVLAAEQAVRVLERSVETQDARVKEVRTKENIGAGQRLDVAQTEAQAAATRADLVLARRDARNGRLLLAFLTSAPVTEAPLVDRLDVPAAVSPPEVFLAMAEVGRQDLAAARALIESSRQNVESAYGEYYPSVSLNINYYLQRQSLPSDSEWNALISLNVPIFTAGRIHADVRTAMSRLRQAKQQELFTRRQIEQDVQTAHENLSASTRRLEELRIGAEAAETALQVAEGRYRAGLGTYLERLIAQDRELATQLDYTREEYNRKIYYLNLLRVSGQLGRPDQPMMFGLPVLDAPTTGPSNPPMAATRPATLPGLPPAAQQLPPAPPSPANGPTTRPATRPTDL